jgi:3-methyladenine DNA glycosylase AlkD
MIVKALSWALREISRRDAARASRFLKDHRAGLAPRVTREVTHKIVTGLKNLRTR